MITAMREGENKRGQKKGTENKVQGERKKSYWKDSRKERKEQKEMENEGIGRVEDKRTGHKNSKDRRTDKVNVLWIKR